MVELHTFTLTDIDAGDVHLNIYVSLNCIFFLGQLRNQTKVCFCSCLDMLKSVMSWICSQGLVCLVFALLYFRDVKFEFFQDHSSIYTDWSETKRLNLVVVWLRCCHSLGI